MTTVDHVGLPARFVVDNSNLGTSEEEWAASPHLAGLAPIEIPLVTKVVVVAPHPDDETLGTGGLLQALSLRGVGVEVCAVTDGEASDLTVDPLHLRRVRTTEADEALRRLGFADALRTRLGLPDGDVAVHEDDLVGHLASRLDSRSLCLAPWRHDGHPDHDSCGRAAAAAAHATGAGLFEYPVWAWHWAQPRGTDLPWASCRRFDFGRRAQARKRWATGAFRSQTCPRGPTGDPPILPSPVLRRFWRSFEVYIS